MLLISGPMMEISPSVIVSTGLTRTSLAFLRFGRAAQLDLHVIFPDTLAFMDKPDFDRNLFEHGTLR